MALALYRKYRPASFAEVVGQEHVTEPLRTALAAGRVNHAYLFSGPRGCGKTSSARILARSLNCAKGPTPDPCGECNSCQGLAPEGTGSVDVVELDAASHGGVDDARELRDKAFYAPAESRYRVFIIDEAHMVTTQGFNALLKIVEEPPEHLIFIFATTEPDKVLPTIRSRTHHYPFRLIPPGAMRGLLERNCAAEGVTVDPAVFPLVIRAGGGSARDTQSVMDQLLSGAGPEGVTYERAMALLGVTDNALINDMVDGLGAGDGAAVYSTIDRLVEAGHDPRRFAADLLDRLRDLVLLKAVPDAPQRGLVSAPEDELTKMVAQAEQIGAGTLSRYAEIVHTGLTEMRGATAARLVLELMCARMLLPSASDTESAVLQRVEQLERRAVAVQAGAAPAGMAPAGVAPVGAVGTAAPAGGPAPAEAAVPAGRPVFQRPSQRAAQAPQTPQAAQTVPAAQPAQAASAAAPAPGAQAPSAQPTAGAPAGHRVAQPAAEPPRQAPRPSAAPAAAPVAAAPGAAGQAGPGVVDAAGIRRMWSSLLAAVRTRSRSLEAMLTNATVHEVTEDTVVLAHPAAALARRLSDARNLDTIAQAVRDVLGGEWQVRCVHAERGAAPSPAASQPRQRPAAPTRPSQQAPQADRPAQPPTAAGPGQQPAHQHQSQQRTAAQVAGGPGRRSFAGPDIPPPDEPLDPDEPLPPEPDDEEELLAEASRPADPSRQVVTRDPEEVMLQLLADELGARPLNQR